MKGILFTVLIYSLIWGKQTLNETGPYSYDGNGRVIIPSEEEIEKLPSDGGEYWNQLIFEKSPYLLQHAANPVDWYPWGETAFALAEKLDKPIFLSIGYTTCHWCHVMEHESFEDEEVAKLLNENFIPVKVDREERPDIDNVYMTITQMMTGRGGWPMTVVMAPDKKPFFAGTYFPKNTRGRRAGMMQLLPQITEFWETKRDSLLQDAHRLTQRLQRSNSFTTTEPISPEILENTFSIFESRFDEKYGGFGDAPKFPKPHDYIFLANYYAHTRNESALTMIKKSLTEMRMGGMYDHIGFGFHRYSVDKYWLVPHFEKMLYDQALLVHAYLRVFELTGDGYYSSVVKEILAYVERDMTSPEGGFFSAEDADSEGEEGLFYVWTETELLELLSEEDFKFFKRVMNTHPQGNWNEGRRHGHTNIPHLKKSWEELASALNTTKVETQSRFETIREKLFSIRENRVHPQKDDKILTDWNGLMISAFARAGVVLNEKKYIKLAENAATYVLKYLRADDGGLLKRARNNKAGLHGLIEDYAFLIFGLIELYQANFNVKYLENAIELSDYQLKYFWDEENKGFFFTPSNQEKLLVRSKEVYDGAIPSGNSVSAYNFIRLGRILSRTDYEEIAHETMNTFSKNLNRNGTGYSFMLQAVDFMFGPSLEILIFGNETVDEVKSMITTVRRHQPHNSVIIYSEKQDSHLQNIIPFIGMYPPSKDGSPIVYVCENYTCSLPTSNKSDVIKLLSK